MKTGTKSLLFGVHQFVWHPITVWLAWVYLYNCLPTWKELICIIIHDWGYWGKANMDDEEGERHPELAFNIALHLFDDCAWAWLCLYHSRHYARHYSVEPSRLCWADKLSLKYEPWWFYLPRAWASSELHEYRVMSARAGFVPLTDSHREWYRWIRDRFVMLGKEKKGDAVPYCNPARNEEKA